MVGAIPRQPRRFWGVPDWQASAASCAKDRLLRGREADPETSRGENCGGSQDGLHWWALYRRVEVGRNMCGLSGPAPLRAIAQDFVLITCGYLQGCRFRNASR